MNKIFDTYLNICNNKKVNENVPSNLYQTYIKTIINQAEEPEVKPIQKKPIQKKPEVSKGEADLKFSIDLATEFSNTVNQFTLVCSKIVQSRMVDKNTSDKVYNLMGKIKDLLDAARKNRIII